TGVLTCTLPILIFSPNGPLQFNAIFLPALTSNNVSNVPSPPSAIGFKLSFVSGNTFFIACLIIDFALLALRLPLKESGALVIFFAFCSIYFFFISFLIIYVALLALRFPLKESGAIVIFIVYGPF